MAFDYWSPWLRKWIFILYCFLNTMSGDASSRHHFASTFSLFALNETEVRLPRSTLLKQNQHQQNLRRQLSSVNKPAVKSIQSSDGDIIDCVELSKQPAFDHPRLKGHKIKESPAARPYSRNVESTSKERQVFQLWNQHENCPVGTIPIRRTSVDDINRAGSIENLGRKMPDQLPLATRRNLVWGDHEHSIAYINGDRYYGAKGSINVWQPKTEQQGEFSLSQMWILSGTFRGDLNTIEAGWQVSPQLYGDTRPRFFIYWTSDAYQKTGCYNLLCSGFVQTSNAVAMGASISPLSSYRGPQYDIRILIWKDPIVGDWWMEFGDSILVGYWPASLFTQLGNGATTIEWGGEVVNLKQGGTHTSTQMGSGHFAEEGFTKASYFRNLQFVDRHNNLRRIDAGLRTSTDRPNCYDIKLAYNTNWGDYFYYGGPGRNMKCP